MVIFGLIIWAVLNFAQARTEMVAVVNKVAVTESFVDGSADPAAVMDPMNSPAPRLAVERLLGNGLTKIAFAAELIVAILFGLIASIRSDADFAGWRHLRRIKKKLAELREQINRYAAMVATAQKECAAGILRGRRFANTAPVIPFFKMIPVIALMLCGLPQPGAAQVNIKREEVHLIDISRSVGDNGNSMFREFLLAVRRLLETEPPNSHVTVMLIASDSFGGTASALLKGRTPGTQGVFDDELQRARKQLVTAFQSRSAQLTPTAAATDIVGGIWRAKMAMESEAGSTQSRDIFVMSDMVETASFKLLDLLPLGTTQALERVKAEGHLMPLKGYRIHIYGASPHGLTPQLFTAIKSFWEAFFEAAGAQLVRYSTETTIIR
jgi:hypothetical protein